MKNNNEYLKLYRTRNLGNGSSVTFEDVPIHVDDNTSGTVYYAIQAMTKIESGDKFFIGVNFQKYFQVTWSKHFGYFHVVPKPVKFSRVKVWHT
jgi:hypothetical protein